jgi:Spy/CpxP family protein refolding chaperone
MLKILLITLTVLGIIAIAGFAWAKHQGYCSGGDFMQRVTDRVSRKLDLNEDQTAKLQGLAEKLRALRGDRTEGRTQLRDDIEGLLAAPTLDRNRALTLLDQRHRSMAERKGELVGAFADFSDSLQPEQRTRLAELLTKRLGHHWGAPRWAH